jgi:hypothetical protein
VDPDPHKMQMTKKCMEYERFLTHHFFKSSIIYFEGRVRIRIRIQGFEEQ